MKKYILIQNDGEIESNSFELIGASTKRDEKGKIGFFGSGLKYSIAYMMRKGIGFKIYSGMKEFFFTTKSEFIKDKSFERICINGVSTSYTTTMGPTWTHDWFVLREIYCNAIDEGSCTLVKETEMVQPAAGKTRIFVELTDTLRDVIANWDAYFADEREVLFKSDPIYTAFLGTTDGAHTQSVSILAKTEGTLYRRNIRVSQNPDYLYDYSVDFVDINEDRTAKNTSAMGYVIVNLMGNFVSEEYVASVLRMAAEAKPPFEYRCLSTTDANSFSEKWVQFCEDNLLVVKEISGKYVTQINVSKKEVFYIPGHFAKALKRSQPGVKILGMGNAIGNHAYNEADVTPKMQYLLKEVLHSLEQMGYNVQFEITVADFDNERIMGLADMEKKRILLADTTFDAGRRMIAMTIMEENEHLISGKSDESREFQDHLFSNWLKYMEEKNGLFL